MMIYRIVLNLRRRHKLEPQTDLKTTARWRNRIFSPESIFAKVKVRVRFKIRVSVSVKVKVSIDTVICCWCGQCGVSKMLSGEKM